MTDRAFGLTFAGLFSIIFLIGLLVFDAMLYWSLWIAGLFAALALAAPGVLLPLNRLWGWFAFRLGHASNYLLLGLFLYVIMTPLGLVLRVCGWDPMARRIESKRSYWTAVGRGTDPATLRDMF